MKVLVCGDRNWTDEERVLLRLADLPFDTIILEGECRGADLIAKKVALRFGFKVQGFPADWKKHGKGAGPIRNKQMLDQNPNLVIAFHENLEKSKGTANTVREAKYRGIPVEVIS